MARFVKGDIVVVPFPFSAATNSKPRPAIVVAYLEFNDQYGTKIQDYMLCMITTRSIPDPYMVIIDSSDLQSGSLRAPSCARPAYLFTAAESRITKKIGSLTTSCLENVISTAVTVLNLP